MKLTSFYIGDRSSYGIVTDTGVIDLGCLPDAPDNLRQALSQLGVDGVKALGHNLSADHALGDIAYERPIVDPEKIICIGVNYVNRNEEYDDTTLPPYPSVFMRTPGSLVGHLQPIVRPPESTHFDYEGEIAIIIGKPGRRISEDQAEDHIAGLTVLQEGSVRDWMRHGKFNVTQGKNFDRSGAVGPWMVTADEFEGYGNLTVTTRVNGEQRQHDSTANLLFSFSYLISYLSIFMTLKTGDIITTGTPTGAGARFDPPRFLVPGDTVEVEVPGVGLLRNHVVDE
ncbi:MAG TPA: fumarylacetoacetate hydrolase family protein [Arenicellales bacterium]|jgi:5-carboxymethyl-2-hydroxymuconate isomerase|nr:fumarylacetoacetate hydrolase family protein [Arenicellales bacterium]MDP7221474.1 fumarylacetoacetate hydrolase family protein [Arenicellales bacterium]HJP11087.1 fumarylacetoacetate hydrolase family protein [Arenicellales bacterium]|tara:strand:- start:1999 stop:2850 length:852 start_codon:yes stop_codon:yes gene_type:complete